MLGKLIFSIALLAMAADAGAAAQWALAKRVTLAVKYSENESSTVDLAGTGLHSNVTGRAEVKRAGGRTRIRLRINNLRHPQTLGSRFTSYVVWAITPEGHTRNLGCLGEFTRRGSRLHEVEMITPHQTFGLIITAEPHALVTRPGPMIIAENFLRKDSTGAGAANNIEYSGDAGVFQDAPGVTDATMVADYDTPLDVLGARLAVKIARWAGAATYASEELREAEGKLAAAERLWPENRKKTERFRDEAREAMRLAEAARARSVERTRRIEN